MKFKLSFCAKLTILILTASVLFSCSQKAERDDGAINQKSLHQSSLPRHQSTIIIPEPHAHTPLAVNPPAFRWGASIPLPVTVTIRHANGKEQTQIASHSFFHHPEKALSVGDYEWFFTDVEGEKHEGGKFRIAPELTIYEPVRGTEALNRIPQGHPRVHARPESFRTWVEKMRADPAPSVKALLRNIPPEKIPTAPAVPDEEVSWDRQRPRPSTWRAGDFALEISRPVANLCLLYHITQDERYANAVRDRVRLMTSLDPDGWTAHDGDDFANSRILNALGWAYSWLHEFWSEEERAQIRNAIVARCRRIMLTADDGKWPYPYKPLLETRWMDPHAWQFVLYHATVALTAIRGEVAEADEWLAWILDMFQAHYPWFGVADGSSAEQPEYIIGTNMLPGFLLAHHVRESVDIDLLRHPWMRNAPYFLLYAYGLGDNISQFGDNTNRPLGANGTLVTELYAHAFQDPVISAFNRELAKKARGGGLFISPLLEPMLLPEPSGFDTLPQARLFADNGFVFMRSDLQNPDEEIFFEFRSSPLGSFGHGHNDQNSFNISAFGKRLITDTGYYDFYNSPHHKGWTQQTRAHNAILFNGTGQPSNTPAYFGEIVAFRDSEEHTYTVGQAANAYDQVNLQRFDRHVLWLKPDTFLVADDIVSDEPLTAQYLLHAENKIAVTWPQLTIINSPALCRVTFFQPDLLEISQNDKFDPPVGEPRPGKKLDIKNSWHLTASTVKPQKKIRFIALYQVTRTGDENKLPTAEISRTQQGVTVQLSDGRAGSITWLE